MTTSQPSDDGPAVDEFKDIELALEAALDRLSEYLGQHTGERSAPTDFIAAILHRYAYYHSGGMTLAEDNRLAQAIEDVEEDQELAGQWRRVYSDEYGDKAGALLASLVIATTAIPPQFQTRSDIHAAVYAYLAKQDAFLGQSAGLPEKQKVERHAERNAAACEEAFLLRWQQPERFTINLATAASGKECVFDHVAPKYGMKPKTLYNLYHETYSPELRKRAARRKRVQ
ncbi:hypothetical protein [Halomonas sp. H5]|uniref:hypothetical protein n=1 Tax=Halomonas sp. H5 TaxID=3423910 RepID=UPI003D3605DF